MPIPTISIILLSVLSGKGQTTFGVKGGLNIAYMSIDGRESLPGFHAGILTRLPLSENYFLQPELNYTVKGARFPEYFYPFDMNFKLNYITMPVLFARKATNHLSIMLGPEISYLLDGKLEVGDQPSNGTDGFAAWDVSLDIGIAYEVTKHLGVDLRYNYGILDVIDIMFVDANGQSLGGLDEGKNRVLQLSISYAFSSKQD